MQRLIEEMHRRNYNHLPKQFAHVEEDKEQRSQAFYAICQAIDIWLHPLHQQGLCFFEQFFPSKRKTWHLIVGGRTIKLVINNAPGRDVDATLSIDRETKFVLLGYVKCWLEDGAMFFSRPCPDGEGAYSVSLPFNSDYLESLLLETISSI